MPPPNDLKTPLPEKDLSALVALARSLEAWGYPDMARRAREGKDQTRLVVTLIARGSCAKERGEHLTRKERADINRILGAARRCGYNPDRIRAEANVGWIRPTYGRNAA